MKTKRRRKYSRLRGSTTHSHGAMKKTRGKGNRGGIGMAGSGKRGDQKKTLVLKEYGNKYFGKDKTLRKKQKVTLKVINLRDISEKIKKGQSEVILKGYKILSAGNIQEKVTIKASGASKAALEKVKKAGGNIILE